nr:hypothetical protein [Tanacetum cinerariifolium]
SQQVATLQEQVSGEEKLKAAFEEFKQYEDDRVEQRCAELDARLDALSIEFDEELYPHMLTAIAGRRWVIGYGLRLAVMKCGESLEMRHAFTDVVSAGIAKGMQSIEPYDPEAEAKYVTALQALKDLKYPLVDQLEGLKDAPWSMPYSRGWLCASCPVRWRPGARAYRGPPGSFPFVGGRGHTDGI